MLGLMLLLERSSKKGLSSATELQGSSHSHLHQKLDKPKRCKAYVTPER